MRSPFMKTLPLSRSIQRSLPMTTISTHLLPLRDSSRVPFTVTRPFSFMA